MAPSARRDRHGALDDASDTGQTDADPFELIGMVQALEDAKQLAHINPC